jgi:nucleotide-binding universal stress UspA family protein
MAAEQLQALQAFTAPHQAQVEVHHEVLVGTAFIEIIRKILRDGHDLLIKPAQNPRLMARLFGSGDMHLLRKCPVPVWITRQGEPASYRSILAAVDFDADGPGADTGLNQQILGLASWLAAADAATLHVAHVWDAPGEAMVRAWANNPADAVGYVQGERARHQAGFDRVAQALRDQLGDAAWSFLAPRFHLRQGAPAEIIPALAEELQADLVVMGTVARTGVAGLIIGNTAENILEQMGCAVLAVKPPGFVSPVQLPE